LTPPNIQDSYQFDCGQKSDLGFSRKSERMAHTRNKKSGVTGRNFLTPLASSKPCFLRSQTFWVCSAMEQGISGSVPPGVILKL
jgi:hypothetical protein